MSELLRPGATQERADEARTSFLVGAITASGMVKSTLGPRGMLKLLYTQRGEPIITNDGATVLKNTVPNGASAKILINSAAEHSAKEGDGTTTLTVLTGELLHEADKLIFKGMHPYKVITEYRKAHKKALLKLREISKISATDDADNRLFLAKTTLSSKFSPIELEALSSLALDISKRVDSVEMVNIIKIPGSELSSSYIHPGLLIESDVGPGQKHKVANPKVLIANTSMDADRVKIFGAKATVSSPADLERIEAAENERMAKKVEIMAESADVIVNRQIIYDYPTQEFTRRGKVSIERADFTGVEMVAKVLKGTILSTFESVQESDLGRCEMFERVSIHGRVFCAFTGLPDTGACSVVIRGHTKEMLEECERSLIGAVKVLLMNKKDEYVPGGGSAEAAVSFLLQAETEGERAYARALMEVVRILADNAGLSSEVVDKITEKVAAGEYSYGVGETGAECMNSKKVKESLRLKEIVWSRAAETAEMLLRCDSNIKCRPRERVHE
ncbi:T-complex protein 1 subunit beta [Nematocida minor]|uniref:T-complex protein 1 subunit beta n=1 Tax=Nematocida minor TaxID=1912983 RepID=UPI002220327E|nr:T-complex protein 1 subunit beta [Nematocida minor]KAI5189203.1 T-complex protein 1 subunit beta [Nematocida minor]